MERVPQNGSLTDALNAIAGTDFPQSLPLEVVVQNLLAYSEREQSYALAQFANMMADELRLHEEKGTRMFAENLFPAALIRAAELALRRMYLTTQADHKKHPAYENLYTCLPRIAREVFPGAEEIVTLKVAENLKDGTWNKCLSPHWKVVQIKFIGADATIPGWEELNVYVRGEKPVPDNIIVEEIPLDYV